MDSGDGVSLTFPIHEGHAHSHAIAWSDLAGRYRTEYLLKLLIKYSDSLTKVADLEIAHFRAPASPTNTVNKPVACVLRAPGSKSSKQFRKHARLTCVLRSGLVALPPRSFATLRQVPTWLSMPCPLSSRPPCCSLLLFF